MRADDRDVIYAFLSLPMTGLRFFLMFPRKALSSCSHSNTSDGDPSESCTSAPAPQAGSLAMEA